MKVYSPRLNERKIIQGVSANSRDVEQLPMVVKLHPKSDSQGIVSGIYRHQITNIKVAINATVERPQNGTNTIIGADFVD